MQRTAPHGTAGTIPKTRQRHHSYDESADEPPTLIEEEAVEIETETPAESNEPVEGNEQEDDSGPPAFEEE